MRQVTHALAERLSFAFVQLATYKINVQLATIGIAPSTIGHLLCGGIVQLRSLEYSIILPLSTSGSPTRFLLDPETRCCNRRWGSDPCSLLTQIPSVRCPDTRNFIGNLKPLSSFVRKVVKEKVCGCRARCCILERQRSFTCQKPFHARANRPYFKVAPRPRFAPTFGRPAHLAGRPARLPDPDCTAIRRFSAIRSARWRCTWWPTRTGSSTCCRTTPRIPQRYLPVQLAEQYHWPRAAHQRRQLLVAAAAVGAARVHRQRITGFVGLMTAYAEAMLARWDGLRHTASRSMLRPR